MGWKVNKIDFSMALHIIDIALYMSLSSKRDKIVGRSTFYHELAISGLLDFFSNNSFKRNIKSNLPTFKSPI